MPTDPRTRLVSASFLVPFLDRIRNNEWAHLGALGVVGAFAFFHHLNFSLYEGDEGLYAGITREMVRTGEFLHLRFHGEPYSLKPPLFFWLLAVSTRVLGENEFALRLPGALFSLGTMVLTYFLGRTLFSRTAGFWAALVVPTTHVFLWNGPRVLFDSALTFFITLALLAFILAYTDPARRGWYLVSFLAMALGTMTKALHAFVLPALLIAVFLLVRRDVRPFKDRIFWGGLVLFLALTGSYYGVLGSEFRHRFIVGETANHFFSMEGFDKYIGARPIYWYLIIMWFDFFPWSVLIPPGLMLLARQRPLSRQQGELFVLLWVLGFLLALSLVQDKREPYLLPVVPGLALLIGYTYQTVSPWPDQRQWAILWIRGMLMLLAIASAAVLVFGPPFLQRAWYVSLPVFPVWFVIMMVACCSILFYAAARLPVRPAFYSLAVLALGFVVGVTEFVLPAITQSTSPKQISSEIKIALRRAPVPFLVYTPGPGRPFRRHEIYYYLDLDHPIYDIRTEDALLRKVREAGPALVLMEKQHSRSVSSDPTLSVKVLGEFRQQRRELVLLSIAAN